MAKKIIDLFPPRCVNPNAPDPNDKGWLHFCEPYAGGLAVLLANDPEGISEVVCDKNEDLSIFWRVLASDSHFREFERRAQATPFSQAEWEREPESEVSHGKFERTISAVETAFRFFVRCRQSMSGRMNSFAPLTRNRTRRGMNEQASAWLNAIEGLPAVHERLKRVVIMNGEAIDVIKQQDGPRTLFYLDPPYLHETRATTTEYGENEMTEDQHGELLQTIGAAAVDFKGRFLLSGYHSSIYDDWASACGWKCHEFEIDNKAGKGKTKRRMTECIWTNF